jgi:hypothetical protein
MAQMTIETNKIPPTSLHKKILIDYFFGLAHRGSRKHRPPQEEHP